MAALHFKLVTPDRTLLDEEVVSVTLPTVEGEITVLPHHAPISALLVPGIIKLKTVKGESEDVAVSGGFIQVKSDGTVMALADTAEHGHELQLSVIEEAKQRAKDVMKQAVTKDDVSFASAAAGLERELARYRVAMKHRHGMKNVPTADQTAIKKDANSV